MTKKKANYGNSQTNERKTIKKLKRGFAYKLFYQLGVWTQNASLNDYYLAVSYTVRDRMQQLFINTIRAFQQKDSKIVSYLSAEFLMGPHLHNNLINLGIYDQVAQAAAESGLDLQQIIDHEEEPGLGNGGLGRLAACYLDSLASLEIPAIGYGIRYEFGMFDQAFDNGWQKELSDRWLQPGNPWEFKKADMAVEVGSGGYTEQYKDDHGKLRVRWVPGKLVKGIPYDTPILGYRVNTVNMLRLWSAEAPKSFDFAEFNVGDYLGAVHEKMLAETISKVLYPNDEQSHGKALRLYQQYFFVSCSMQDMIRIHLFQFENLDNFSDKFAVQLNDTHPAIAVPEFMRLLVDVHHYDWDSAWEIVTHTFAYTNHTLLPEALEKWPVAMLAGLLGPGRSGERPGQRQGRGPHSQGLEKSPPRQAPGRVLVFHEIFLMVHNGWTNPGDCNHAQLKTIPSSKIGHIIILNSIFQKKSCPLSPERCSIRLLSKQI